MRALLFALSVIATLLILSTTNAAPASAAPRILIVDDDKQQCTNADFTSIQAAVLAANPGDTIRVCPGAYDEAVTINKTLRLAGSSKATPGECDNPTAADPAKDSIVQASNASGIFNLQADGIELEGFIIRNNTLGPGIYSSPAFSGYQIKRNLVQNNVFGLYFNASGATRSTAQQNCFRMNTRPGAASGNGIYSDQGLNNAGIEQNRFFQNPSAGIVLTVNITGVTVSHNESIQDGSLIAIFFSNGSAITHNKARNNTGSAIFVGNDNVGLEISHNDLRDGNFHGIRVNATAFGGGPNTALDVNHNDLRGFTLSGIAVAPNSVGSSLFAHNNSRDNGQDGIRIEAGGNGGNQIAHNQLRNNTEHDCHDDTAGTGTAGTANTWEKNQGQTENRPGLCTGKP